MTRLLPLAIVLGILAGCTAPEDPQAVMAEPVIVMEEAPAKSADLCDGSDDGIGGTGCSTEPAID